MYLHADCITPFPSCDLCIPTGNRKPILPRRDHWQRLQRTSGECSGSTILPLSLCSPSLEKWAGYASAYFLPLVLAHWPLRSGYRTQEDTLRNSLYEIPWMNSATTIQAFEQLIQSELSEKILGMNTMELVYEENVVAHCGVLFFTPYRKNATSTGQQRGQPDTSTLWWTPWPSITCPSISWESSKWLMPG